MQRQSVRGMTLVEVMVGVGVAILLVGMAIPLLQTGEEQTQVMAATQYLVGRATQARSRAVMSGAAVGLRFRSEPDGYAIRSYLDGDGDGVSTADISSGVDSPLEPTWYLRDVYPAAILSLDATVPPVGGSLSESRSTPVRFGPSGILTFTPLGTASSGTIYVKGVRTQDQYAVRVLGVTGRIRILRFDHVSREWIAR